MPRLPYTNFHDLNLNWFLKEFKKIIASVSGKQDAPAQAGTPGQVLGLNDGLQPVWVNPEGGGTTDYTELENKPSINGVELSGNKTGSDYRLIDTPATPGTAGQVLGLDESLTPKWIDQEGASIDLDITGTASGAIASFDDGANNEPLVDLQIAIEPVQAGTGDPSPSNIRPISGWTGVNVYRTGKNLLNIDDIEDHGYYNVNGVFNGSSSYNLYKVPVKSNTSYTISGNFAGIITYWDANLNFLSGANQGSGFSKTFTTPTNCAYIRRSILISAIDGIQQLELGTTATAYEPYKGTTYPITWEEAGTVYGRTLNPVTGELVIDMVKYRVPLLTENQIIVAADNYIKADACDGFLYLNPAMNPSLEPTLLPYTPYCNMFKFGKTSIWSMTGYVNCFTLNRNQLHLNIANDLIGVTDYTQETRESVRTKIVNYLNSLYNNGNYIEVCYKITPITYTLTPTERIRTLLGFNNIWADTGNILQCVYKVDPDIYLKNVAKVKILTPLENSIVLKPFPTTYNFGERTTLTLTATADTYYKFMFKCPSNAVTNITINGAADTAGDIPAAGKTYIVEIWAGIANYTEVVLAVG